MSQNRLVISVIVLQSQLTNTIYVEVLNLKLLSI